MAIGRTNLARQQVASQTQVAYYQLPKLDIGRTNLARQQLASQTQVAYHQLPELDDMRLSNQKYYCDAVDHGGS